MFRDSVCWISRRLSGTPPFRGAQNDFPESRSAELAEASIRETSSAGRGLSMARAKSKSIYGVHPGVAMVQNWIISLPQKTGRTLDEWIRLVQAEGPPSEQERRDWLKAQHGLGTSTAWWIVDRAAGRGLDDRDPDTYLKAAAGYVAAMFAGKRAGLRPI